jgi:hypothetical protein
MDHLETKSYRRRVQDILAFYWKTENPLDMRVTLLLFQMVFFSVVPGSR